MVSEIKLRKVSKKKNVIRWVKKPPDNTPIRAIRTEWHGVMTEKWMDHFHTNFEEVPDAVNIRLGVNFDQKLIYITCHLLSAVGPTVIITILIAVILFIMSERLFDVHCKSRKRPIFYELIPWSSSVIRHGGLSDFIIAWHYFLLYILEMVLALLVFCDHYVFIVHFVTGERMTRHGECIFYSGRQVKRFVFVPIWFLVGSVITGSSKQHRKELYIMSIISRWCLRIEFTAMVTLGAATWQGRESFLTMIDAYYYDFQVFPVMFSVPVATILLHQYLTKIPVTFGRTDSKTDCSDNSSKRIFGLRLSLVCIYLGFVLPFHFPYYIFRKLLSECLPFCMAMKYPLAIALICVIRCIHIVSSIAIGMSFASHALFDMANSGLIIKIFLIRNPVNNSPILSIFVCGFLTGLTACFLTLDDVMHLLGLNILFARSILSLSLLLRERYGRSVEKVVKKSFNVEADDFIFMQRDYIKIWKENNYTFIFFTFAVIGLLGMAITTEWVILTWFNMFTLYKVGLGIVLVFLAMALSPLFYISSLLIMKKVTSEHSPTPTQILLCVVTYIACSLFCACSTFFGGLFFVFLLTTGISFYYIGLYQENKKQTGRRKILQEIRNIKKKLKKPRRKMKNKKKKKKHLEKKIYSWRMKPPKRDTLESDIDEF